MSISSYAQANFFVFANSGVCLTGEVYLAAEGRLEQTDQLRCDARAACLPVEGRTAWSAGLVRPGIGGGITLTKSPDELTILEIVNAVEPIQRITTCPLGMSRTASISVLFTSGSITLWQWSKKRLGYNAGRLLAEPT